MLEKKTTKKTAKSDKKVIKKVVPKKDVKLKKAEIKTKVAKKVVAKKTVAKKTVAAKTVEKETTKELKLRYYEAVGRRKRAVARVRLFTKGDKMFVVNKKPHTEYFKTVDLQGVANGALKKMKVGDKFSVSALVKGGGQSGQAEAVRHGISRALLKFNPDFQKRLKRAGFLSRDPREKERRKFGLKKARKAPQWGKR